MLQMPVRMNVAIHYCAASGILRLNSDAINCMVENATQVRPKKNSLVSSYIGPKN
jgi:hypothetical protein